MKILIVSDTHRSLANFRRVLEEIGPIDMLIHLGDVEYQEEEIMQMAGCPAHIVAGNNDFMTGLSREEEFYVGRYKVFITHGHAYYVGITKERIQEEARLRHADIVMYGHTHVPVLMEEPDLITLNPGSLTYPRQKGWNPSYIVMTLHEKEEASFEICYLD